MCVCTYYICTGCFFTHCVRVYLYQAQQLWRTHEQEATDHTRARKSGALFSIHVVLPGQPGAVGSHSNGTLGPIPSAQAHVLVRDRTGERSALVVFLVGFFAEETQVTTGRTCTRHCAFVYWQCKYWVCVLTVFWLYVCVCVCLWQCVLKGRNKALFFLIFWIQLYKWVNNFVFQSSTNSNKLFRCVCQYQNLNGFYSPWKFAQTRNLLWQEGANIVKNVHMLTILRVHN